MNIQYRFKIYTALITSEFFLVSGIIVLIFYLARLMYWLSFTRDTVTIRKLHTALTSVNTIDRRICCFNASLMHIHLWVNWVKSILWLYIPIRGKSWVILYGHFSATLNNKSLICFLHLLQESFSLLLQQICDQRYKIRVVWLWFYMKIWTFQWGGQLAMHIDTLCICVYCMSKLIWMYSLNWVFSYFCTRLRAGWPAGGGSRRRSTPHHLCPRWTPSADTWRGWDPVWTAPPGQETHGDTEDRVKERGQG